MNRINVTFHVLFPTTKNRHILINHQGISTNRKWVRIVIMGREYFSINSTNGKLYCKCFVRIVKLSFLRMWKLKINDAIGKT